MIALLNISLLVSCVLVLSFQNGATKIQTASGYRAQQVALIEKPRGLFVDDSGDILILSSGTSCIFAMKEIDGGQAFFKNMIVDGRGLDLTHGVTYREGYVYASSASTVYRWRYVAGTRKTVTGPEEVVIKGMPTGGHVTRTLIFDAQGRLLVTVGSADNVDPNSNRARIRRFDISATSSFPVDFNTGEVFADGTRNVVGLAYDKAGDLWGVDNAEEDLDRPDLGVNIGDHNPGDELHHYSNSKPGGNHGFPYCFSSDILEGYARGTQFAWPTFMNDGVHTDAWCRNIANNIPPVLVLPAHTAPLGIEFYSGQGCEGSGVNGAFPCDMKDDAIVAYHGSWRDSNIRAGYSIGRIQFSKTSTYAPTGNVVDIAFENDPIGCQTCFRPVNAVFNKQGHLFVSDDSNDQIVMITYNGSRGNMAGKEHLGFGAMLILAIVVATRRLIC